MEEDNKTLDFMNLATMPSELVIGGVYLSPLLVASVLGVILAWVLTGILNLLDLSRFVWWPPHCFLALSGLEPNDEDENRPGGLGQISLDLERRLNAARKEEDTMGVAIHGLLGSIRGLVISLGETRKLLRRLDWDELSKARF